MINITLTITAAPELLAAMTNFTSQQVMGIQQAVQTVPIQVAAVPISTQTYTMEQLAAAATQIVDAGHRAELVNLLSSFGVQALTALPKEQYGAFATQLKALGDLRVQNRNTEEVK